MDDEFVWNSSTTRANFSKHGIGFDRAVEVFADPLAIVTPEDHGDWDEPHWIAMGMLKNRTLAVVIHTYEEIEDGARVRLVAARWAIRQERWEYEAAKYSTENTRLNPLPEVDVDEDVETLLDEYDFCGGVRGLHYLGKDAKITFPVYLEPDVLAFYADAAHARELSVDDYLSEYLRVRMAAVRLR